MVMTDDEIVSAAARLRAAKRRRVRKSCEVCGEPFEGIAQRRYCSDTCRVRASRRRRAELVAAEHGSALAPSASVGDAELQRRDGEPIVDYLTRLESLIFGGPEGANGVAPEWDEDHGAIPPRDAVAMEPPRGEDESLSDYLERLGYAMTRGRIFEDDSAEIIRQSREERTAQLLRASGIVEPEPEPPAPRGEDEPLLDYLERVTDYVMGDRADFDDDTARLVRQGREERTAELLQAIGMDPVDP